MLRLRQSARGDNSSVEPIFEAIEAIEATAPYHCSEMNGDISCAISTVDEPNRASAAACKDVRKNHVEETSTGNAR